MILMVMVFVVPGVMDPIVFHTMVALLLVEDLLLIMRQLHKLVVV